MSADDEGMFGAPRRVAAHEIGQNLDALSIDQITESIALLEAEIVRLQDMRERKRAALGAAASFFKT